MALSYYEETLLLDLLLRKAGRKVYLKPGQQPPPGATVKTGERGSRYYESQGGPSGQEPRSANVETVNSRFGKLHRANIPRGTAHEKAFQTREEAQAFGDSLLNDPEARFKHEGPMDEDQWNNYGTEQQPEPDPRNAPSYDKSLNLAMNHLELSRDYETTYNYLTDELELHPELADAIMEEAKYGLGQNPSEPAISEEEAQYQMQEQGYAENTPTYDPSRREMADLARTGALDQVGEDDHVAQSRRNMQNAPGQISRVAPDETGTYHGDSMMQATRGRVPQMPSHAMDPEMDPGQGFPSRGNSDTMGSGDRRVAANMLRSKRNFLREGQGITDAGRQLVQGQAAKDENTINQPAQEPTNRAMPMGPAPSSPASRRADRKNLTGELHQAYQSYDPINADSDAKVQQYRQSYERGDFEPEFYEQANPILERYGKKWNMKKSMFEDTFDFCLRVLEKADDDALEQEFSDGEKKIPEKKIIDEYNKEIKKKQKVIPEKLQSGILTKSEISGTLGPLGSFGTFLLKADNVFVEFDKKTLNKSDRTIEGFLSVEEVDNQGDLITINSWKKAMPIFMKRGGTLLDIHQARPCGRLLKWDIRKTDDGNNGVWIKCEIFDDNPLDQHVMNMLEKGVYQGFSFGGMALGKPSKICKDNLCYRKIDEHAVWEATIAPKPACPTALLKFVAGVPKNYSSNYRDIRARMLNGAKAGLKKVNAIDSLDSCGPCKANYNILVKSMGMEENEAVDFIQSELDFIISSFGEQKVKAMGTLREELDALKGGYEELQKSDKEIKDMLKLLVSKAEGAGAPTKNPPDAAGEQESGDPAGGSSKTDPATMPEEEGSDDKVDSPEDLVKMSKADLDALVEKKATELLRKMADDRTSILRKGQSTAGGTPRPQAQGRVLKKTDDKADANAVLEECMKTGAAPY